MSAGVVFRVLSFMAMFSVIFAADSLDITVSATAVTPGEQVTITCVGTVEGAVVLAPLRQIIKTLTIGGTEMSYTVSSAGTVYAPFNKDNRYSAAAPNPSGKTYTFSVTIRDVSLVDSGMYSCKFIPTGGSETVKSKEVTVLHPAESINMVSTSEEGGEISLLSTESISVVCTVHNYHPKTSAAARILVGDEDVTSLFTMETTENVTGETEIGKTGAGLVSVLYTTKLTHGNFRMAAKYSGKHLKCQSGIGGTTKMESVLIHIKDSKPGVVCPQVVRVNLNDREGFNITCTVTPAVNPSDVKWMFNTSAKQVDVDIGGRGHFRVHTNRVGDTLTVTLKYGQYVRSSHFGPYMLVVNGMNGKSEATTLLQDKEPGRVGSGALRHAVSALFWTLCFTMFYSSL